MKNAIRQPSAIGPSFLLRFGLLPCLAACSGGGGGGGARLLPAALQAAVFTGSSSADTTPDPGETLTLFFTDDVTVVAGRLLDDTDLILSAGTLGTPLPAPSQLDARTVRITLGTGVSFTPGTDTIAVASAQDAVFDRTGTPVGAGAAVLITVSDGDRPVVQTLTLNAVPDPLNGNGAAGGLLQVPPSGFTVDATFADGVGSINPAASWLSSDRDVNVLGQSLAAGGNLIGSLTGTQGPTSFSLTVPATVQFPAGDQTLSLTVSDVTGNVSAVRRFSFRVRALDNERRPLEAGQTWFLDLSRDTDTISSAAGGGGSVSVTKVEGANGTPDLLEDLLVIGLRTATPIANVIGTKNSNDVALDILRAEILAQLGILYPQAPAGQRVSIAFTFTDPGPFPSGKAFVPYDDANSFGVVPIHSRIAIGAAPKPDALVLGVALFDPLNRNQDNDFLDVGTYNGVKINSRLGIFPHTLIKGAINLAGTKFRVVFDPFITHRGTPIGNDAADATRLVNIVNRTGTPDTRQARMQAAFDDFGRFLAVLLAHECGHSLGLVKDGAMPAGLYGNDPNFPGSSPGHISLQSTGIFPAGATEVMAPTLSFETTTHPASAFNPLILGYLRERVLYDN